ncbi:MAG: response regulator [Halothece sp.]
MMIKDQQQQEHLSTYSEGNVTDKVFLTIEELLKEISSQSQQQFTGRLTLETPQQQQWRLYFGMGRLLWASGGEHPRRRWRRQLAFACGRDNFKAHYSQDHLREGDDYECWDFHLLLALHKRKIFSAEQVKRVMGGIIAEVLFDLNRQGDALCTSQEAYPHQQNYCGKQVFTRDWQSGRRPSQQMVVPPSWGIETDAYLKAAQQQWHQWREAGLTHVSPDRAPRLLQLKELEAKTSPAVYKNLVKLITGDATLRDLSVLMNMEIIRIARSLQPYLRQNLIGLETVSDLPPPTSPPANAHKKEQLQRRADDQKNPSPSASSPSPSTAAPAKERPLLAFVDDSEQSRGIMEQIVTNGGYDFLGIGDSVEAIPLLLERQPQLIFLDLIMPNISGYELCSQLRKISSLKQVPVVIVTGNDGIVDRMRAKMVGATNFISKPIDRSQVLSLAVQYLHPNN